MALPGLLFLQGEQRKERERASGVSMVVTMVIAGVLVYWLTKAK